jgi:enediyne biosynthesis protein E3
VAGVDIESFLMSPQLPATAGRGFGKWAGATAGSLRRRILGISPEEVSFAKRGFYEGANLRTRSRLELIGRTFLEGYHNGLETTDPSELASRLERVPWEFRGFAYEGAAMGWALLDRLTPWTGSRVQRLLAGPGEPHAYVVHVAVGWTVGRLGGRFERILKRLDPLLGWLAVEGYGFHEGFFKWRNYLQGKPVPKRLNGYARRAFDQGLGRSLWFVDGADTRRIPRTIAGFPSARQGDLWSGLGLSCVYAGEAERADLHSLQEAAGEFRPQLAQGGAFAAKARERAGNLVPYTDLACRILCGLPALQAARITDEALENLPADSDPPAFEIWRGRIQEQLKRTDRKPLPAL